MRTAETYHHPVPLSRNLGTFTSWNPLGHSGPVMGLNYLVGRSAAFNPATVQNTQPRLSASSCLFRHAIQSGLAEAYAFSVPGCIAWDRAVVKVLEVYLQRGANIVRRSMF